jgi:hypothetical protein
VTEVVHRDTCRLCGSTACAVAVPLAPSPIADAFVPAGRLDEEQPAYAMDLYLCLDCGALQLLDVIDPELLFRDYLYTTSSSPGLVAHFETMAADLARRFVPRPGSLAVDIGSNDGALLQFLKGRGMTVLGVDPARDIAHAASAAGVPTIPSMFDSRLAAGIRDEHGGAALVTANNVFAHSDALGDMADGVRVLLGPDGVFVFEVAYLLDMLDNFVFDSAYHEHLHHHSLVPLRAFLLRHGLELFDVERLGTKGGSIRCFAQLHGGGRAVGPAVERLVALEEERELGRIETYHRFSDRLQRLRADVRRLLGSERARGSRIYGFGASATGTTLTQHFGLADFVSALIDDRPERQGLYSPGHHLPVLAPDVLYGDDPPDMVVVMAWRFAEPIISRHEEYLRRGGRFVVPVPRLTVVDGASPKPEMTPDHEYNRRR